MILLVETAGSVGLFVLYGHWGLTFASNEHALTGLTDVKLRSRALSNRNKSLALMLGLVGEPEGKSNSGVASEVHLARN